MEFWGKVFPPVDTPSTAKRFAERGAYGVLVFVVMYLLGLLFAAYLNQDPVNLEPLDAQSARDQVIGSAILIPVLLLFAYRVFIGKGWLVAAIVLVWFAAETSWKVLSGSSNAGWIFFYVAVAALIANGLRGCWSLRGVDTEQSRMAGRPMAIFGVIAVGAVVAIVLSVEKKVDMDSFVERATPTVSEEALYNGFKIAAERLNARGSVMLDDETSWDHSEAGPGARITYYYSFPNYASDEFAPDRLIEALKPGMVSDLCKNPEVRPPLEEGGVFTFVYAGNDAIEITRFDVSKQDCGDASQTH